jgi:hypothetical protein
MEFIMKLKLIFPVLFASFSFANYTHALMPEFQICNKSGQPLTLKIEQAHNLKLKVSGSTGYNTKSKFDLKTGECGMIEPIADFQPNDQEHTAFNLKLFKQGENGDEFNVRIKSDPTNIKSYLKDTYHWTIDSVWSNGGYDDGLDMEAFTVDSLYCFNNGCKDETQKMGGTTVRVLSAASAYKDLIKNVRIAPENHARVQRIDIIQHKAKNITPIDEAVAQAVYNNFQTAYLAKSNERCGSNSCTAKLIRHSSGAPLNAEMFNPNKPIKLCKVYDVNYRADDEKGSLVIPDMSTITYKPNGIELSDMKCNPSSSPQKLTMNKIIKSEQIGTITTTTDAWKIGSSVSYKVGWEAVVKKEFSVTFTGEYSYSKADTVSKMDTVTYELASQTLDVPPMMCAYYTGYIAKVETNRTPFNINYDLGADYATARVDVADNDVSCADENNKGYHKNLVVSVAEVMKYHTQTADDKVAYSKNTGKLSLVGKGYFEGSGSSKFAGSGAIYFKPYSPALKATTLADLKNMAKVPGTTRKIVVSKKPLSEATLIHQQSVDPFQ